MDTACRRPELSPRIAYTVGLIVALAITSAPVMQAQRTAGVPVTGVVRDQTGAVLAGAAVELVNSAGAVVLATTADSAGAFRFDTVLPGAYELHATFTGFKPARAKVRVGTRSPASQQLVLEIANLTDEITVSNAAHVDTSSASNVDAIAVDQNMLESLPIFDQDYIGTISRFLDSGSLGSGGVTLVVNGMEVNALRVSASAVQQIKINQDPYSAEFSRPGRGRIEILTKPGGQAYEGELNVIGRNARFDARNVFAATKPPEQKHIVEGVVGGPLGHGGKTSFLVSASDQLDDQAAIIFAVGPAGVINDVSPQPNRQSLASGSITRQHSDTTTISIRPSYEYESNGNRGVGGTTLASAGTNFLHREEQLTYNQQSVIRPTLLHQFQILVGHEREPTTSASAAPGIVVAGAFTGGGHKAICCAPRRTCS